MEHDTKLRLNWVSIKLTVKITTILSSKFINLLAIRTYFEMYNEYFDVPAKPHDSISIRTQSLLDREYHYSNGKIHI